MHKLLYFATIGLLAFSIGGCGDGGGGNTASPSPSPGATSPSPTAAASPTPAAQSFPSPVVAAQPPGLIRSTNPDERAKQAQTGIGENKNSNPTLPPTPASQSPLTPANLPQIDPFGQLPPIAVQTPAGVAAGPMTANPLPKLPQREVAIVPKLPEFLTPPPINRPIPTATRTRQPTDRPRDTQQVAGRPRDPLLPGGNGAQLGSLRPIPGLNTPQIGRGGRNGSLPGGEGAQVGSPRQVPGLNAPNLGRRPGQPGLPGGEGAQVGSPRQVPGLNAPNLGRRPGQPGLPGGEGAQVGSPRQVPGLNAPNLGRRPGQPGLPGGEGAQVGIPAPSSGAQCSELGPSPWTAWFAGRRWSASWHPRAKFRGSMLRTWAAVQLQQQLPVRIRRIAVQHPRVRPSQLQLHP
ncbi:MAG: hypothetical protein U7126_08770 [Microcoleus sp.]